MDWLIWVTQHPGETATVVLVLAAVSVVIAGVIAVGQDHRELRRDLEGARPEPPRDWPTKPGPHGFNRKGAA